ncbi:hypothetical protein [Nocardia seriolae]|uniref:Glycosyltransferase RgtA/B/C/D-like domain-containing protein n=1 Tax=Nocardia seriolae TaxID=37332 RepID=A0A0B8N8M5_9NOCA|nr:hypothetical protein [Nocardia seriolae]APA96542.1 hypothetical protein NS506_02478 [Nocardia seriolae]MTJ61609.1 hypothetical protein [Nocardia seriolae]MTJ71576.1 hypothetical protein [Nocardia seriolae]MTJ86629.1 hypothetical protein [Nocardia seriolae]MTK30624.1 hypothetical protein [Nocardia seriolae]
MIRDGAAVSVRATGRSYLPAAGAFGLVLALAAVIAATGVVVTAGGNDQRAFHWPSVEQLRTSCPHLDLVGLNTATGPLYHLVVAAISGPLGLGEHGTQVVGALFAGCLAALAVRHARALPSWWSRGLAVAPLLLSAYFWQSALWMLTDDAALVFAMAAMMLMLAVPAGPGRNAIGALVAIGVLVAAAIATRQTFVWLLAPAALSVVDPARPLHYPRSTLRDAALVLGPGIAVLAGLIALWGGLTPPAMRQFNAANPSWTAIAFTFAVAAIFAVPVLAATAQVAVVRTHLVPELVTGLVVAAPAVVFRSAATKFPDDSRRGGVLWTLVGKLPVLDGRSPVLAVLAFVGGFACAALFFVLERRTALLMAGALVALAVVTAPGSQLYQKYAELPIAMLAVLVIVEIGRTRILPRTWPLAGLAAFQLIATAGIVGVPVVRALGG